MLHLHLDAGLPTTSNFESLDRLNQMSAPSSFFIEYLKVRYSRGGGHHPRGDVGDHRKASGEGGHRFGRRVDKHVVRTPVHRQRRDGLSVDEPACDNR